MYQLNLGDTVQISDRIRSGNKLELCYSDAGNDYYQTVPNYIPSHNDGRIGIIVTGYSPIYKKEIFEAVVHNRVTVQFEDAEGNIETLIVRPGQLTVIEAA